MSKRNVEDARKVRRVLRANTTRYISKLKDICDAKDDVQVEYAIEKITGLLRELKNVNMEIQESLNDEEIEADIIQGEEYEDELERWKVQLTHVLKNVRSTNSQPLNLQPMNHPEQPLPSVKPRLPELKLPEFNGEFQKWQTFWEQFKASVDNNNAISVIDKHIYLRNLLKEDALALVAGVEISENNYEKVKEKLEKRYGNKDLIIQTHIDFIDKMKASKDPSSKELRITFNELQGRIDALRALGENIEGYGRLLTNKILRLFPKTMCLLWYRHSEKIQERNATLITELLEFLNKEIERNETVENMEAEENSTNSEEETEKRPVTTENLHVHSKRRNEKKQVAQPYCVFCEKRGHWGQNCTTMSEVKDRKAKLKLANRCFLCMGKEHKISNCRRARRLKCGKCGSESHHTAICDYKEKTEVNAISTTVKTPIAEHTYLQTARVWIQGSNGKKKLTRCVLDTGSHVSFIEVDLAKELELRPISKEKVNLKAFESSSREEHTRQRFCLTLCSTVNKISVRIEALESTNSYSTLPSVPVTLKDRYKKIKFADPDEEPHDLPIQILIGSDYYWSIVQEEIIRISDSLALMKTKFGWIANGGQPAVRVRGTQNYLITQCEQNCIDSTMIGNFWELDAIGIKETNETHVSQANERAIEHFQKTFRVEEGRGIVSLPWTEKADLLKDNLEVARKRYEILKEKLNQNESLRQRYTDAMSNYFKEDQVERVPTEANHEEKRTYYLPHQAVIKEQRRTTKVRIVFDASSHGRNTPSLNQVLHAGPNLNPESSAALLRFRLHCKALAGDGTQAFLQLVLNPEDRDATRFLWYEMVKAQDGTIQTTDKDAVYRFTRLPFGLNCSPFLLAVTIRTYAQQRAEQFPTVTQTLGKSLYVDDFTSGADDDGALQIYNEITTLTSEIHLPMGKWVSNSQKLRTEWQKQNFMPETQTKVLGFNWNTEPDEFWFDPKPVIEPLGSAVCSKRLVLTTTARLYDPLGLISPISITGKVIFQDTWNRNLDWDDVLPHDLADRWNKWIKNDVEKLTLIKIPRWVAVWQKREQRKELHAFCDASERAYGAAIYIKTTTEQEVATHLLISKSRLAPIKKVTLPRLELLATLIGTRLMKYVKEQITLHIDRTVMWSDSTVALSWIKGETSQWKTFVANRVIEIKQSTSLDQWRYCPTRDNPADHLTRGLSTQRLEKSKKWWLGPEWLAQDESFWPNCQFEPVITEERNESQKLTKVLAVQSNTNLCIDIDRVNSYQKLLRIMGWILRFIKACKKHTAESTELGAEELNTSKKKFIFLHQRQHFAREIEALLQSREINTSSPIRQYVPFIDESGILRLGGRLQFAELTNEQKHPILLEGKDRFVKLLIRHEHNRLFHMGTRMVLSELRGEYWILHGRQAVRQVIRDCLICKKAKSPCGEQIEAPLPVDRIKVTPPFETTGIDFAGPLYVTRDKAMEKTYIALFTCAITRAIHVELVSNMTTERFILALQRFFGRRGVSKTIYTDNAKTFKAADKEMQNLWKNVDEQKMTQFFAHQCITWKFIIERAAWWGGWWERMVQTTKRCLRKAVGKARLDEEELRTVLIGVEAAINSRPITYMYSTPDEEEPLTPAHFLTGHRLTALPTSEKRDGETDVSKTWRKKQLILDSFWRRWTKEYLLDMRTFHSVRIKKEGPTFKEGDVVLVCEEKVPRHMWKMGRIIETMKGRDGRYRSCVIKTANGTIRRPIQLLVPLELHLGQGGECQDQQRAKD